jgi:hypothetical protein
MALKELLMGNYKKIKYKLNTFRKGLCEFYK